MLGALLNILLFIGKYFAGKISGSVSIMADAFNNLTDAGTFCVSAMGLRIASIGPGKTHPEGHGKFEWIIALITSISVFLVGWELLKSSLQGIENPADMVFSWVTLVILSASIVVKVFLYFYNTKKSKTQNLLSLKAVALDSISDAFSTLAVLLSLLLNYWYGWQLDGWFGLAVSVLIMYNAISSAFADITKLIDKVVPQEQIDELITAIKDFFMCDIPIYEVKISDHGLNCYSTTFHITSTGDITVSELVRKAPLLQEKLKKQFGYTSDIQIEEAADIQIQKTLLNTVHTSLRNAGVKYEVSDERVIVIPDNHFQVIMTIHTFFMTKQEKEKLSVFLSDKVALGLSGQDSLQIAVHVDGHHVGTRSDRTEHFHNRRHHNGCKNKNSGNTENTTR